jgi:hypothetical protein
MFAGIFIVVGWGSVEGNGIVHKTLYLLRDPNLVPSDHPLKEIKKSSIMKFIGVQWLFFAAIIAISETIGRSRSSQSSCLSFSSLTPLSRTS